MRVRVEAGGRVRPNVHSRAAWSAPSASRASASRTAKSASIEAGGVTFTVRAPAAVALWLCLFDGEEEHRVAMARDGARISE